MRKVLLVVVLMLVLAGAGFGGGYLLGSSSEAELSAALAHSRKAAKEAQASLKLRLDACDARRQGDTAGRKLLLARIQLHKALAELDRRNFGLSSQHMGNARLELKAQAKQSGPAAAEAAALYERIGKAQTETMQLSKKARASIEAILTALERLPGK